MTITGMELPIISDKDELNANVPKKRISKRRGMDPCLLLRVDRMLTRICHPLWQSISIQSTTLLLKNQPLTNLVLRQNKLSTQV